MIIRKYFLTLGQNIRYCSSKTFNQKKFQFSERIFSGIQPTGSIHLGNYFGAIAQWVKLQNQNKNVILSVVDLHAMTLPHDPESLSKNILNVTSTILGCGIDPDKLILFQQSSIPEHTQISWCLGCICTMPRLSHLPQYKEKSKGLKDIPLGLFIYPVLQAADILTYKTTHVPVGEDQLQQIQLAQDLAKMFNKRFGNTFPIPHAVLTGTEYAKLRSLRDPLKKMSKSDPDPKSKICINDKPDDIIRNIKKAVTDFKSEISYNLDERPGVSNLISIHSFITNKTVEAICEEAKNLNTGQYKLIVAEAVVEYLKPIQENIARYMSNPDYLTYVLRQGNEKAQEVASKTWEEIQCRLGLKNIMNNKDIIKLNKQ